MKDYRQIFESGIHMLPQVITTCRDAGVSDEEFLKLCADIGKYFTAVSKLKSADDLPEFLQQKRMRALDGRIIKSGVAVFERLGGVDLDLDFSNVPMEEGTESDEVIEQMVSGFEDPAAVQTVDPPIVEVAPVAPVTPTMSFAQAVVSNKMKEYVAQVRGQA